MWDGRKLGEWALGAIFGSRQTVGATEHTATLLTHLLQCNHYRAFSDTWDLHPSPYHRRAEALAEPEGWFSLDIEGLSF